MATYAKYKVSYISAKSGEREVLRDYKGNVRYYSHDKAKKMKNILSGKSKGRIVKV